MACAFLVRLLTAVVAFVATAAPDTQEASAPRRLEPQDLFRVEEVGAVAWAGDGSRAAIEMVRPSTFLDAPERRSDIWMVDAQAKTIRRLTDGARSGMGFWSPAWSPDGRRLAFLSIDGTAVVRPWIWERKGGEPRAIEDLDLPLHFSDPPIVWLDGDTLLVLNWPKGSWKEGSLHRSVYRSRYAQELWQRAREMREPAVTVLESGGRGQTIPPRPEAELVRVNLVSGSRSLVARGPIHRLQASPDRRSITFFASNPGVPTEPVSDFLEHQELYDSVNWGSELHVFDVGRGKDLASPVRLVDQDFDGIRWSAGGGRLVLAGRIRGSKGGRDLVLYEAAQIRKLSPRPGARAISATWLGERLVALLLDRDSGRLDWWALSSEAAPVNMTATMRSAPSQAFAIDGGKALLGEADGDLWRISPGSIPKNLTEELDPPLTGISPLDVVHGVFQARVGGIDAIVRVSGEHARHTLLRGPGPAARLRSVAPTGEAAVWTEEGADGSRLWLSLRAEEGGTERAVELWRGNRWVEGVRAGSPRAISYKTKLGEALKGWVLLPPGWRESERVPFVVVVYPGAVYDDSEPASFRLPSADFLHPQLFSAKGYGVLLPSMPMPDGPLDDMIDRLPTGVLPAVDRIIELKLADPDRIALVGQSFGGYATLGLLTQTNRFRAAIASASYSDLLSLYGTFYGSARYGDDGTPQAHQVLRIMQVERGYAAQGGPPWKRLESYLHNSPLLRADKVETPLMLVHGDMDFVPMQQDEEFFTSLYRQDKRCRFVRYHGESHTVTLRPNVLDLWSRIEAWLGEFLGGAGDRSPRSVSPRGE